MAENVEVFNFLKTSFSNSNSDWMSTVPTKIQNMPLSGIAIPGSHDSFTALLDYKAELGPSPDLSETLIKVINFFGKAAKKIIYNWGVTQALTLEQQLEAGIRYLDFRVASRESKNGDIYLLHSLYAQSAKEGLMAVNKFLSNHPKEVVIIDINHFYGMSSTDHRNFARLITEILGSKLASVRSYDQLTLANLWKEEKQVVLIYHASLNERDSRFWSNYHITSPWLRTNDVDEGIAKLDRNYALSHQPSDCFWVTQGVLTPEANDIIWGVLSSLRKKLALPMTKATTQWLADKKIGVGGVNVVVVDFVDEYDFIQTVINLNFK